MRLAILLASVVILAGCRSHTDTGSTRTKPSGTTATEAGRCHVTRHTGQSAECHAVHCAEDFIRRNGYTTEPASGQLQRDPFDMPLEKRHALLYGRAIIHKWVPSGHFVGFRYRDSSDNVGRAVVMTDRFDDLKLDHLSFVWPPAYHLPDCDADAN